MVGVITNWDILAHPISTIQCFGWRVFFRAIVPWHDKSFLSLLRDAGFLGAATSQEFTILERCIACGDIDADGDLDICSKLWRPIKSNANGGRNHFDFLENLAK